MHALFLARPASAHRIIADKLELVVAKSDFVPSSVSIVRLQQLAQVFRTHSLSVVRARALSLKPSVRATRTHANEAPIKMLRFLQAMQNRPLTNEAVTQRLRGIARVGNACIWRRNAFFEQWRRCVDAEDLICSCRSFRLLLRYFL